MQTGQLKLTHHEIPLFPHGDGLQADVYSLVDVVFALPRGDSQQHGVLNNSAGICHAQHWLTGQYPRPLLDSKADQPQCHTPTCQSAPFKTQSSKKKLAHYYQVLPSRRDTVAAANAY